MEALPGPDDDLPLLDRILTGDAQAFDELVQRHKQRVYRIAMAVTSNHEDAEEAMQQTFLKVHQHLSGFERTSKFTTWLTRIAINEALQKRRRLRKTESLDTPTLTDGSVMPKQLQDWHDNPERIYSREQMREIVESAIQSLPTMYREAFVVRDVEGLTTEEASEVLQISVPALKTRLLRARLMMREALAGHFQRPATLRSKVFQARWRIQDALMAPFRGSNGKKEEM
ncbi:MAG: sigma-70 family RNA polymerase sigma factor [Candidatus Acidiferrales bacterium]